ncbi:MarR family winged helix-turn-helix transcriptional regulator [Actinacidiphila soli]|uniref:MarR family winged helix-turn-helix transcriptional regulator n=1 Tax=Actinacidiphila soli TaxID=2487275 RepID=UPI000FCA7C48|nr:MarR family transcriptional regulator [Actinacidiphila soli]
MAGHRALDFDADELASAIEEFTRNNIRLPARDKYSFTTLSVLHTLTRKGPMRLTALTATEQITQPAVTQLVTRLEGEGLVERHPAPEDRRAVLVRVTDAGARIINGRRQERVRRFTELADQLTPEERHSIAAALPALTRMAALMDGQV